MKQYIQQIEHVTLFILPTLFLVLLCACEKDVEQTTNPSSENVIEKSSELSKLLISNAQKNINEIGCVAFQYPLSFSVYNKEIQVASKESTQTDKQLLDFLKNLSESLIVSLDFPVRLSITNKEITLNNNTELISSLNNTPQDCENNTNCSVDTLRGSFAECPMYITSYNESDIYNLYKITFSYANGDQFTVSVNDEILHEGSVGFYKNDNGENILALETDWEVLNGEWTVVNCDSFSSHNLINGQNTMHLQGCQYQPNNPFECFKDFENLELSDIEEDGKEVYNLTAVNADCANKHRNEITINYYTSESDANTNLNAIKSPESYAFGIGTTTVYTRVNLIRNSSVYQLFKIKLGLYTQTCDVQTTETFLFECSWRITKLTREGENQTTSIDQWNMTFLSNKSMTYTNSETQEINEANYSVSQVEESTILTLPFVSDNFETLADEWQLRKCSNDKLEFFPKDQSSVNNSLIIERVCN